ncbi:hypothetical protein M0813_00307 [Anaeramoeba flamelloides]|uniref:Tyr recombinase domain-containing protein n=1 Tax=Anaeramoeba flamelloides TaxID=1746091 RepID=A0ABQ8YAY4_9EUKA|nr:hypothetical protein M0813_00307 [Anaeramoeba flamelloides]
MNSSQEILEQFSKKYVNKNTKRTRNLALRRFDNFLEERSLPKNYEKIDKIDNQLCIFISRLRQKKTGDDYNWNSYKTMIHGLFGGLKDYFEDKDIVCENIPTLDNCKKTRNAFQTKLIKLKKENKVGKKRQGLTIEEEEKFFKRLNLNDSEDLIVAAFWCIGKFTGIRGGENFNLKFNQVSWHEEYDEKWIEIFQTVTKTDQGGINCKGSYEKIRKIFHFKKYKYDPYTIIRYYFDHLPERKPKDRIWSAINRAKKAEFWYKKQNMGPKKLQSLLDERIKRANIKKKITFHSTRSTVITNLVRKGIPDCQGKSFTGHESSKAYNSYKRNDPILFKNLQKKLLISPQKKK